MLRFCSAIIVTLFALLPTGHIRAADDGKPNKTNKPTAKTPKFELRDGDRVVFLGNTLIERAQTYGYWETMLTARYPNKNITFRNLGWSGDTVWAESRGIFDPPAAGYKRMIEHVARLKPTVIFLGYGGNEAFAGKKGLPAFIKQYNKLLDDLTKVSAKGVRFVILSPTPMHYPGKPLLNPKRQNLSLAIYAAAIQRLCDNRDCCYVDLLKLLLNKQGRSAYPHWNDNGIHFRDTGYQRLGGYLIGSLDAMNDEDELTRHLTDWYVHLTDKGKVIEATATVVRNMKANKDRIKFTVTDTRLPGPGDRLLQRPLKIDGLPEGNYVLRVDGKAVHWGFGGSVKDGPDEPTKCDHWAIGQFIEEGPEFDQVERLRQAIIDKNRLYFYRWRPQNITYLFLFRKHEQGQNVKELAEFDKLIAAKEKEIAKLRKPVAHTYEIIRVKDVKMDTDK